MKSSTSQLKIYRIAGLSFTWRAQTLFMSILLLALLLFVAVVTLNTGRNPFGFEKIFNAV